MAFVKPKVSKLELQEQAMQVVAGLESQIKEFQLEMALSQAKMDDAEKKIRWVKRELLGL